MPLVLGDFSAPITHEYRPSDVRVLSISAPAAGSVQRGNVTVTFVLQSFEVVTCDIAPKYTLDGDTLSAATVTGDVTGLACSPEGTEHTLTWHSVDDIGSAVREDSVQFVIVANDTDDDDQAFFSDPFAVDNLPTAPEFLQDTGEFRSDRSYPIQFSISDADPGADKLFPYFQADLDAGFGSDRLVTYDSSDGATHARFDHLVSGPTLKPLQGYYVAGITVSGATTVTYADLVDLYTGEAVPASIPNARVIIIQRSDRRVRLTSASSTQCGLHRSAAGAGDTVCDLYILSDPAADFYVITGVEVTGAAFATIDFSTFGTDSLGQAVPATIDPAPRIIVVDEVDRMGILGTITATGVALRKSAAGHVADARVTLLIAKANAAIYQDDAVSVPNTTPTAVLYTSLSDGGALPAYIPGSIVCPVPRTDRHIYIADPFGDQVRLARSAAGASGEWVADVNIWTSAAAGDFWQPMSPNGIPAAYLGGTARLRPLAADLDLGEYYMRVRFGNLV